jgi:hypothetical protein
MFADSLHFHHQGVTVWEKPINQRSKQTKS